MKVLFLSIILTFPLLGYSQINNERKCIRLTFVAFEENKKDGITIFIFENKNKEVYFVLCDSNQTATREVNADYNTIELKKGKAYNICLTDLLFYPLKDGLINTLPYGKEGLTYGGYSGYCYKPNDIQNYRIVKRKRNDMKEYSKRSPINF